MQIVANMYIVMKISTFYLVSCETYAIESIVCVCVRERERERERERKRERERERQIENSFILSIHHCSI